MKWKIRRLIYWLLGIPDEIEESIGGLNWATQQNAARINSLDLEIRRLREGVQFLRDDKEGGT
jgi:hypothetical protein